MGWRLCDMNQCLAVQLLLLNDSSMDLPLVSLEQLIHVPLVIRMCTPRDSHLRRVCTATGTVVYEKKPYNSLPTSFDLSCQIDYPIRLRITGHKYQQHVHVDCGINVFRKGCQWLQSSFRWSSCTAILLNPRHRWPRAPPLADVPRTSQFNRMEEFYDMNWNEAQKCCFSHNSVISCLSRNFSALAVASMLLRLNPWQPSCTCCSHNS